MHEVEEPALRPAVNPPDEAALELTRLRRHVRAQVFGGSEEATRIGRFRLLECIGRGGMGVVWSARDEELDRTVAIKLLRPEFSGRDVTAEARALARLSHPNVVSVFDIGVHGEQRFIAMEFVRGQTLRAWQQASRGIPEVVAQFIQAGRGLAAAHAVGLVHRDFKPDNVLVGDDGRPRVLDFGLARSPDVHGGPMPVLEPGTDPFSTTMTHAGLLIGTPAYMAPEQHLGEPAGAQSDQFAFGVSLFEAIVGRLPFPADDLRTLSLSVVRGRFDPPPPHTVPAGVMAVIERALQVEPEARYPSVEDLLTALENTESDATRFDTRGADAVLSRAASLAAADSGRRGLSVTELEEVAAEAGIEPRFARLAAAEAIARPEVRPAVTPPAEATSPLDTAVPTVRARLPRLPPRVVEVLVAEMDRRAGPGKTRALGASTVWESRRVEMHLDPTAEDTRLVLTRKPGLLTWTRPVRYAAVALAVVVSTVAPLTIELFEDFEGLVATIILCSMIWGVLMGRKFARRRDGVLHERKVAELQRSAARLQVLAESNLTGPPLDG
ncbi:MAG: serine/threonine-protein kinase [Nannocystales bacterium]